MNDLHINFKDQINGEDFTIKLNSLVEGICQGGPLIGTLFINGKAYSNDKFSGPMLEHEGKLYIPKLKKSLFHGFGFELVSIDIKHNILKSLSGWKSMVLLKEINGTTATFFTDIENLNESSCRI